MGVRESVGQSESECVCGARERESDAKRKKGGRKENMMGAKSEKQ